MGMIGSAVGMGLQVGSAIFGGVSASKAMNKVKGNLEQQQNENQNWYDRRYNEDATQRADAQRVLAKTEEMMKNRNRQAAGTAAVMGGTEESLAAARAANSQAMAEAASRLAVNAEARKDGIESQYMANRADLNGQLNNLEIERAQAISNAVDGVAQAGADMASAF